MKSGVEPIPYAVRTIIIMSTTKLFQFEAIKPITAAKRFVDYYNHKVHGTEAQPATLENVKCLFVNVVVRHDIIKDLLLKNLKVKPAQVKMLYVFLLEHAEELLGDACVHLTPRLDKIADEFVSTMDSHDETFVLDRKISEMCKAIKGMDYDISLFEDDEVGKMIHALYLDMFKTKPQGSWFDPLKLGQFSESMVQCVDKLIDAAETFTTKVDRTATTTTTTLDGFVTRICELFKHPVHGAMVFFTVYVTLQMMENFVDPGHLKMTKALVSMCAVMYIGKDLIERLVLPWMGGIVPQSGFTDWASLVIEGISLFTLGFNLKFEGASALVESVSKIARDATNISNLVSRVTSWIEAVITKIAEALGLQVHEWFMSNDATIRKLQSECNALVQEYLADPMNKDVEYSNRVARITMELNDLALRTPAKGPERMAVDKLIAVINNLIRNIGEQGIGVGDRDEPGLILYAGAPGVGKTYFADFMMQRIAVELATSLAELAELLDDWKSKIYVWPLEGKHHDQYKGEPIILFPDLFAKKDVAGGTDSEPLNLIFLIGGQSWNLPAAELTKKQRLWMVSQVVVACTNVIHIPDALFASINNADAVRRRVNECGWFVYCNPRYAKRDGAGVIIVDPSTHRIPGYENHLELYGMIDPNLIPPSADGALRDDLYFARKLNFSTGRFANPIIYTQETMNAATIAYLKDKKARNAEKRAMLKTTLEKIVEQRRRVIAGVVPMAQAAADEGMIDPMWEAINARLDAPPRDADTDFETASEGSGDEAEEEVPIPPANFADAAARVPPARPRNMRGRGGFRGRGRGRGRGGFGAARGGRRGRANPQAARAEFEYGPDWFKTSWFDDDAEVKRRGEFLQLIKEAYTVEVHDTIKRYWMHASHGCRVTVRHECACPDFDAAHPDVFKEDLPVLDVTQLSNFKRLLANDHRTVFLFPRMRLPQLEALAFMNYADAHARIDWLITVSEYGTGLYGALHYTKYVVRNAFAPLYERLVGAKEWFLDLAGRYRPQLTFIMNFVKDFSIGFAISSGICILMGLPMGLSFVDRRRTVAAKHWDNDALAKTFSVTKESIVDVWYTDYDEYKAAEVIVKEHELHVPRFDISKVKAQGGWKMPEVMGMSDAQRVAENCYVMFVSSTCKEDGKMSYIRHPANMWFIGEHYGVTVEHAHGGMEYTYVHNAEKYDTHVILVPFNSEIHPLKSPMKYMWTDLVFHSNEKLKASDQVVIEFPKTDIRIHSRLDKMIPPKACIDYIQKCDKMDGIFLQKYTLNMAPIGSVQYKEVFMSPGNQVKYNDVYEHRDAEKKEGPTYIYSAWRLTGRNSAFTTVEGDCASVCILTDPRKNYCTKLGYKQAAQPWLCYSHTAVHGSIPRGAYIYREMFDDIIGKMKTNITPTTERIARDVESMKREFESVSEVKSQGCPIIISEFYRPLDACHYSIAEIAADISLVPMSNIKRSKLYGIEERLRAPARLRDFVKDGEVVQILPKAEANYGSNTVAANLKLANAVRDEVVGRIFTDSETDYRAEKLTLYQALFGDAGHNLKGINMDSSAGMQLRLIAKHCGLEGKGKKFMLDDKGEIKPEMLDVLERLVMEAENILSKGDRITNVYIHNLKDELVLKEKVAIGKTRLFCSADFLFLILCRMYFGAFSGWIYRNRIKNGIAIGINVYSKEWDALYYFLNDFTDKFVFGDYSGFDKLQRRYLMEILGVGIRRFYGDRDIEHIEQHLIDMGIKIKDREAVIRYMLLQEIFSSIHLTVRDGKLLILEWDHGNTSGNFFTAILNSFVNIYIIHLVCVYAQLLKKGIDPLRAEFKDVDWEEIVRNVRYIVLGDDVIVGLKNELATYVNFHVMASLIPKYIGLEFTDELKGTTGGDVPSFRGLLDGSFLGRKFRVGKYRGMIKIFAPLRMYSVVECLQWTKGISDCEIEIAKVELVNRELVHWGYDEFIRRVPLYGMECREKYGRYPRFMTWESAEESVMTMSTDRYSFETFLVEDTYKESDLVKLGLLQDLI